MRGRKPKPIAEKKLLDFPGKRKPKTVSRSGSLKKPKSLSGRAAELWDEIEPQLIGIHQRHSIPFADFCRCVQRMETLEKEVEAEGFTVPGAHGDDKKNPKLQTLREYRNAVQRWASEFGLTPCSQARLGSEEKAKSKESGLISG